MKKTKPLIFDYSYLGLKNERGEIKQLWEEEALTQSIKLWIASFRTDAMRNPQRGGYVTRWLMTPMNQVDEEEIVMSIRDGIYQDFSPYLEVRDLRATPNFERRYWEIYMEVYSPTLKVKAQVSEKIKAGL